MPSIYLAYGITARSIFERNAEKFVQQEFRFSNTQVVTKKYVVNGNNKTIELLLVGQPLNDSLLDVVRHKMPESNLKNTKLIVYQGLEAKQKIDLSAIKASVLEEIYKSQHVHDTLPKTLSKIAREIPDIRPELYALFPNLLEYSLGNTVVSDNDYRDTLILFSAKFKRPLRKIESLQLNNWLKQRLLSDSVKIIFE